MIKGKYIFKCNGEVVAERDNLITTNGFLMINRFLTKSSMDWAGSLVIGALNTAPAISDKTLYYETARVPVTLKSYSKFNPKYIVTNKQLVNVSTTVATVAGVSGAFTLTLTSTVGVAVGSYVTGTNVGTNAQVTAINGSVITVSVANAGTVAIGTTLIFAGAILTFQSSVTPTMAVNYNIQVTGVDAALDGTYTVTSLTTITPATINQLGTYTATYTRSAVAIASTASGGLIKVLSDAIGASVYNNEIVLKGSLDAASALQISEIGAIPLTVSNGSLKDNVYLTSFSEPLATDASKSAWTVGGVNTDYVGVTAVQGSVNSPSGYTWYTASNLATWNVASTLGLKVGSSVYIAGTTASSGAITINGTTATVSQVNGNNQVILTMSSTNSSGVTQSGYGGTLSLNSTTQAQPSYVGQFNIKLAGGTTATLSNIYINTSNYGTTDSLMLLYYASAAISAQTFTVALTDSAGSTFNHTASITVGAAGWYSLRIPLTNFATTTNVVNTIAVSITGSVAVFLDGLKFITSSYWSAHPSSASALVNLPAEYQLSSRSIFSSPVVKSAGQQMDVEYHIQVT